MMVWQCNAGHNDSLKFNFTPGEHLDASMEVPVSRTGWYKCTWCARLVFWAALCRSQSQLGSLRGAAQPAHQPASSIPPGDGQAWRVSGESRPGGSRTKSDVSTATAVSNMAISEDSDHASDAGDSSVFFEVAKACPHRCIDQCNAESRMHASDGGEDGRLKFEASHATRARSEDSRRSAVGNCDLVVQMLASQYHQWKRREWTFQLSGPIVLASHNAFCVYVGGTVHMPAHPGVLPCTFQGLCL